MPHAPLPSALLRALRPLARVAMDRGLAFQRIADLLKRAFVEAAEAHFRIEGRPLTDSRVSLLTGLQRKDVKALRGAPADAARPADRPYRRLLAAWIAEPAYLDAEGRPKVLPPRGPAPSFETLAAEVGRDVHPRTLKDELIRLGLVREGDDGALQVVSAADLPRDDEDALLDWFGGNLGDHAAAAAENLAAAPGPAPHFERAVRYDGLSSEALDDLARFAAEVQDEALRRINARALEARRGSAEGSTGRFRCGAFVFRTRGQGADP